MRKRRELMNNQLSNQGCGLIIFPSLKKLKETFSSPRVCIVAGHFLIHGPIVEYPWQLGKSTVIDAMRAHWTILFQAMLAFYILFKENLHPKFKKIHCFYNAVSNIQLTSKSNKTC